MEKTTVSVMKTDSVLTSADQWDAVKIRLGIGRMRYAIPPGLYMLGEPDQDADVLVTANYKLSFDHLRSCLAGLNLWVLVLDTKGVNVWCAAGKGTFGTAELLKRIDETRLRDKVSHRELIVPQLGAPGIAAHRVKKYGGFTVTFGPVRAEDIPHFLKSGKKAFPGMRRKRFPLKERITLIPVELLGAVKWMAVVGAIFLVIAGLTGRADFLDNILQTFSEVMIPLFLGLFAGAVLTPALLPHLPGRAFSVKGMFAGLMTAALYAAFRIDYITDISRSIDLISWLILITTISTFLGMNFTGASTYTSLSGVKKEMKTAVPLLIIGGALGLFLWLVSRLAWS